MEKEHLAKSELVLTPDKSIYHLHLKPDQIADTIFLVGDPGRVQVMSSLFDSVEHRIENREFVTHTGYYKKKRLTVLSTGIGTDNIDIVVNELDALVNIDFNTREVKPEKKSLRLIRIGTSGALHAEIDPGSVIVSDISCGLDNLLHYYRDLPSVSNAELSTRFMEHMDWPSENSNPYFIHAAPELVSMFNDASYFHGITLSAPGFYAPQGRSLRMHISDPEYINKVSSFRYNDTRINNFEMEGSALCGLSQILGHQAITICIALANRITGRFITEYQPLVKTLLKDVLDKFA
jgi:uridine phosphorylase